MQQDFDIISDWSHDNGLVINSKKTKFMHMKPNSRKICDSIIRIYHQSNRCIKHLI